MMIGYTVADFAVDSVRIEAIAEPFQASCIIGEFLLEVLESKVFH
jgi:hypothetical protein